MLDLAVLLVNLALGYQKGAFQIRHWLLIVDFYLALFYPHLDVEVGFAFDYELVNECDLLLIPGNFPAALFDRFLQVVGGLAEYLLFLLQLALLPPQIEPVFYELLNRVFRYVEGLLQSVDVVNEKGKVPFDHLG